jgi:hypothetical protein
MTELRQGAWTSGARNREVFLQMGKIGAGVQNRNLANVSTSQSPSSLIVRKYDRSPLDAARCAIKPRSAPELRRWGAESMRHFASSHIQPFAPSPACLVVPVREVSAVPSLPHTRRFAAACASFWRPLRGAPLEASAQVRASRGQASACVGGHGSVVSLGRPLLLGRLARVTRIRRVPSSAHRGRRIASADSCATRVACGGFAFASRIRIAHSALAPAHVVPASPVNRSAPTHRSRGRCAMKPRSAPELKRFFEGQPPSPSGARGNTTLYVRFAVCSMETQSRASLHGGGFVWLCCFAGFGPQSLGVCHPTYRFGPNPSLERTLREKRRSAAQLHVGALKACGNSLPRIFNRLRCRLCVWCCPCVR